ncbi:MAG: putative glycosyltransferase 2 fused to TPR-repeat domain [Candidatus Carbobacillus altaicus]|uniref:Putative glycosyltransferase 2 fused to TPR-repeat domain n=1 Tax=Candidatus Carbonibacillus altaicus TaxID=2163959 RepID=A0A2R6Y0F7_9BACL|nr:MAG: putative glycosyltransferase 2 fused to TPR-repeat domain [Candidatus Carbobacillus altaicus]
MPDKPLLSLVMIARDEARSIARALQSARPWVDEMIVGDTGSTDPTPDIAHREGAHVIHIPWENDFARARNALIQNARGDWILSLDADEWIDTIEQHALHTLLADPNAIAYEVRIFHLLPRHIGSIQTASSAPHPTIQDTVLRLFRRDPRIVYSGRIHEDIHASLEKIAHPPLTLAPLTLFHDGYLPEVIEEKQKNRRNMELLKLALDDDPTNPRLIYALATEYFQQENYEQAVPLFKEALAKSSLHLGYTPDLVLKYIYALKMLNRIKEARYIAEQALRAYPDFPDLWLLYGEIILALGDVQETKRALETVIRSERVPARYPSHAQVKELAYTFYQRLLTDPSA